MNSGNFIARSFVKSVKGVRAHKIPRFSFSIEERGVLGEYVEVAMTRNIQFYVSTAIHHSRSISRKERKILYLRFVSAVIKGNGDVIIWSKRS